MILCPCYNKEWDKCLFPGSIIEHKIQRNFKDEPERFNEWKDCPHQKYYGGTSIEIPKTTREAYFKMIRANTHCMKE